MQIHIEIDTVMEFCWKMSDKLNIHNEMRAMDLKDRGFYDSLNDEERKKFSPFLMIRWGSTVNGSADMQAYYLMSVNENLNRNFFDINATQHKKLQWLMATTVSPGLGAQRHNWLAAKKRDTSNNRAEKFLMTVYPDRRADEIRLLAELNSVDQLRGMARDLGWDDRRIKESL